MISFNCPNCGAQFEVEDELAGARVACSECETRFYVPVIAPPEDGNADGDSAVPGTGKPDSAPEVGESCNSQQEAVPSSEATPRSSESQFERSKLSPRQRRLTNDYCQMTEKFSTFPLIHLVRVSGNPPEAYVVSYHINGIERINGDRVVYRDYHEVEIKLPGTYPRTPPVCRMLTPIFHPNIEPAIICIGDHWTAAERLCDLVVRIGEMIAYQAYNIKSPLDGEAAMWADLHQDMLPTDNRDLLPPD